MNQTIKLSVIFIFCIHCFITTLFGQERTVGLFVNDSSKVCPGYILFSPKHYPYTYLINNEGRIINQWTKSIYEPGQSVYLLENGNLLRTCMVKGKMNTGGGEGGRIEEYDWDGNLVWELDFSTETYMQHHDIRPLPNGNIIMLVVEKKTYAEVIAAGFNPAKLQPEIQQKGIMVPDYVAEIKPTKP
ncbi:MAG: aryl-sulfate sulfotransferase, partial [bacterium]|nr:aryl-sulfate sulfotransferase [bacterium]